MWKDGHQPFKGVKFDLYERRDSGSGRLEDEARSETVAVRN